MCGRAMLAVALFALLAFGNCSGSVTSPNAGAAKTGSLGPLAGSGPEADLRGSESGRSERSEHNSEELPSSQSRQSEEETNRKIRAAFKTGDAPTGSASFSASAPSSDRQPVQPAAELHGNTRHVMDVADKTPPPAGTGTKEKSESSRATGDAAGDKTAAARFEGGSMSAAAAGEQENTGRSLNCIVVTFKFG